MMEEKDSLENQSIPYFREIIDYIIEKKPSKNALSSYKAKLCKKYSIKKVPTDIEILLNASDSELKEISKYLLTKPGRTISGVAVIAIMSYPFPCPHGSCIMCPANTKEGIPQSYTGKEPAAKRGIRNKFDSYLQVMNRLEQYIASGHIPQKAELIIMGGTFLSFDAKYQENFVTDAFRAMNDFSSEFYNNEIIDTLKFKRFFELPGDIHNDERTKRIQEKLIELKSRKEKEKTNEKDKTITTTTLEEEQKKNESAFVKCVGLTIETRPDYCTVSHCNEMLRLGCTRIELGVQTVYDHILERIERKHSVKDTIDATRTLKDMGFKINYHMMPGLPDVTKDEDMAALKKIMDDPSFRPDMIKIYPCMVLKGTKLYDEWKNGKFSPLTTEKAAELISEFKEYVPEYVRIMRVQRDIPSFMVSAGVDRTNLRQYIEQKKPKCRCIRCREAGHVYAIKGILPKKLDIVVKKYEASGGLEYFISMEDIEQDIIVGFCRLRIPGQELRSELTKDSALIRELHVYGSVEGIEHKAENVKDSNSIAQHKGIGKKLLAKAEEIAKEKGRNKVVVISGVGVRNYYRKRGYEKEGPYMVKNLN